MLHVGKERRRREAVETAGDGRKLKEKLPEILSLLCCGRGRSTVGVSDTKEESPEVGSDWRSPEAAARTEVGA